MEFLWIGLSFENAFAPSGRAAGIVPTIQIRFQKSL
jgi:hypothetical protein